MRIRGIAEFALASLVAALSGCASDKAYQKAFSDKAALMGNSKAFAAPANQTVRMVKQTLVHQGFTVHQADMTGCLIKATRSYQNPSDVTISYNIDLTVNIMTSDAGDTTDVLLGTSKQTVLHRESHDWWHLLWVIPLFPIGTEYQTVVIKEGNVTDAFFYNDFFAAVDRNLNRSDVSAAPAANTPPLAVTAPASAAAAPAPTSAAVAVPAKTDAAATPATN